MALIYLLDHRIIRAEGGHELRSLYRYPSTPVCMGLTGVLVPAIPVAVLAGMTETGDAWCQPMD
ncbi:hypothetical protein ABIF65_003840 [Bradyrhizobium japonicum]|uniref:hypothetical protein n=1 Tax=Bradyrhizobium TaxID=374 RepID=UPI0012BB7AE0|nr:MULTISPECIES: hypothetical protein [Bradyrhizobium]MBR1003940.1 hypothetical protein [Bradyrhizobium liaoningense]MBR1070331.1 hypothetical protein [Bradyrhizobium liaoningense]MCP1741666.1 hypothetical protein [Bradyrhizobium japonicum]MCP1779512.1 hypothetical protein [Bradyrhizobium japonicum]MCP1859335.1 hypothetical protein [Bradyrhizobium japonicum]